MNLKLAFRCKSLGGSVLLPSSKSISNRLLIIQHLSGGSTKIQNLSDASDTQLMISILQKIHPLSHDRKIYHYTENAGTVMRFLLPVCAITQGNWYLTGSEQMKQRPIEPLVTTLNNIGACISYAEEVGYPPLNIKGRPILGGYVESNARQSSQFISALLMAAPYFQNGMNLKIPEKPVSEPYIRMTIELMKKAGIHVVNEEFNQYSSSDFKEKRMKSVKYSVEPGRYQEVEIEVESDWSSVSYIYAMAAFSDEAEIFVPRLYRDSLQGDAVIQKLMAQFGIHTYFKEDGIQIVKKNSIIPESFIFSGKDNPDLVQTLMVLCAGLGVNATFTGISTLRFKETDRVEAMVKNLKKTGINIAVMGDMLQLSGMMNVDNQIFVETFGDHRMAMAFAPLAIAGYPIVIEKSDVVKKSFPNFWHQCRELGYSLTATE